MTTVFATATQRVEEPKATDRSGEGVFSQYLEIYDSIARRAFEVHESRGSGPGHEVEDWLRAESEILHPAPLSLMELDGEYVVRVEVPGFRNNDIRIRVQQRLLVISGEREATEQGRIIHSEWRPGRILRTVDLPSDVEPAGVRSELNDGILIIDLPKVREAT